MKSLVSRIRQKVELNPLPLRRLSLKALQNELVSITVLLRLAADANREAMVAWETWESSNRTSSPPRDGGFAERASLIKLLVLRQKLCQAEIARVKFSQAH